ncbi:nitroreductase family protein [Thermovirga lienii]|uniref:nitroreductase family protein n=1 Tax=Thermovirga lienii TaxID=336261 RepID=UPI002FE04BF7
MLDILRKRRSIRKYQERPIEPEKIETLKEGLLRSPSAKNLKSWEFVFVENPETIKKLAQVRGASSSFLAGAPLAIVVMGNEQTTNVWVEDASLAAMIGQLVATSIGLGSCWIQIRNRDHSPELSAEDYVRGLLGIPEPYRVLCILAVGYPAEEKKPIPKGELPYHKIHTERF